MREWCRKKGGCGRTLERPDDERRCRRYDSDLGLTVLDGELYSNAQTLPSGGRFCNIFSDLLWGLRKKILIYGSAVAMIYTHEAERTDFGCKGGRSTNLTAGCSEVDDFYFVGVL